MSHIVNPTETEGAKTENLVSDDNVQELLEKMLVELKKISLHLAFMNDNIINDSEVE